MRRLLAIGCAVLALWVAPLFGAGGADGRADLYEEGERAELLVVHITAPTIEGAGILFHVDEHYTYVLTARHVLFQQGRLVEGLTLELRAWPGRQLHIDRESYRFHYQDDLAVFRADLRPLGLSFQEIRQGIPLDQLGASTELDPGDALASLGHSTAGAWISPKAPIRFARGDGDNAFLFEHDCPPGHSGGAVFDEHWRIVGMMIEEIRPYCRALRIEAILRIVQGWKVGISLHRPPPSQGRDKASTRPLTVAVVGFDNRSARPLPDLGFAAQTLTTSHLYTLPGVVLVARDRPGSVRREIEPPDTGPPGEEARGTGKLLVADVFVTGSIVRYDVERRTVKVFGTSACKDLFRMAINLQILDAVTKRVRFSKNFDIERMKQYPKTAAAPSQPIDLASELLEVLLTQARNDIRSALAQVAAGLDTVGGFVDVSVRSTPAGADVIVGGIYMGKTPTTLQLTLEGTHEIQVVLASHEPWIRRFRTEPGKGIEVNLVPKRP
ncbi:MAG TPA: trypsin-like peptidase domain-containing protein [Thermoanaerobaculia bacterium]|nr:trypsin-like peptidase domain-containing protein [Thermoanaerobaculia bacterium]